LLASIIKRYGEPPYYVEFTVAIPIIHEHDHGDFDEVIKSFVVEMAPLDLMPHSVHLFLEQVAHRLWDNGWFYLNGPHVFQAGPQVPDDDEYEDAIEKGADERILALKPFRDVQLDTLAFPEYSDKFPHLPWTLGFTGRPGGPDFYINKVDNSKTHGPGGQTHHTLVEYADPCFGKIIDGMDAIEMMKNAPTISENDVNYRFFFEEPIQMVKVRIVKHPSKLSKITEAISQSKNEGQQQEHAPNTKDNMNDGKVEVTVGDVQGSEQHHERVKQQEQQHQQHEQQHREDEHHDDKDHSEHHDDEDHSEHHRTRHRKSHKLADIRPEHTVEA
jgi:cyclophilin family peptidyl-prolyl cis-trans isomerase